MIRNNDNTEKILVNSKFVKNLNVTGDKLHCEAGLYVSLGRKYVIKKIGRQYKLNSTELILLEKSVSRYYDHLKKIIPNNVPKIFLTKIDKEKNCILLVTEYLPLGKVTAIKDISMKIKYFNEIIKLILKISNKKGNTSGNKLKCSIDPNPDNFFLDSENKIVYNDFTPPLYRENGKWVEFRRRDEAHAKKSEKETRYFSEINLLLAFINKTRLYLTLDEYLKFSRSHFSTNNKVKQFVKIFDEVRSERVASFDKLEKHVVRRDLLRFALSFRKGLTSTQVGELYKKSKKPNGVVFLEKKYISLI
ncbi:MAG TPA: hypothetical protein VJC14_02360 [Candidatus Paceibacterota bacterium]